MSGHRDLPWAVESSDELGERAAARFTFRWVPEWRPNTIQLAGSCPRCEGTFTFGWPLEVVRELDAAAAGTEPVPVQCLCGHDHRGRPDGERGCGAHWRFDVPRPT